MRGVRRSGEERDDLLLVLKSAGAAVAAWLICTAALPATVWTYAPFTSLLALQATVYRSVSHAWRYMGAMVAGVLLAAFFGITAGIHAWSLAILLVASLTIARLRVLGAHGIQVAVTALFAFTSGGGRVDYIGNLVAAVVIGVGCGLVVSVFLPSPPRFLDAGSAVARLSLDVDELLSDIADALREDTPDEQQARHWAERAARIGATAQLARGTVESGEESARLNPRRLVSGGYRAMPQFHTVINTLERVGSQTQSLARGLSYATGSGHYEALARDFLGPYADLLTCTADAAREYGAVDRPDRLENLRASIDRGRRRYYELVVRSRREELDVPGEWPLYGTLLTDAHRILDELDHGRELG